MHGMPGNSLTAAVLFTALAGAVLIGWLQTGGTEDIYIGRGIPLPLSKVREGDMQTGHGRGITYLTIWLLLPVFTVTGYCRSIEDGCCSELKTCLERSTSAGVTGRIEYISIREDGYQFILNGSVAQIGQISYNAEKIIAVCDYSCITAPKIGDVIYAEGKLYPCEKPSNPGQFDADRYYSNRNIDARLYVSEAEITDAVYSDCNVFQRIYYKTGQVLFKIRCLLSDGIYEVLPDEQAGALVSMLTGDRGMLDSELKNLYSDGGIAHILSISALHVSLLGMGLYRLLMKLFGRLLPSSILTIIVMLLYGMLTGFSVSTVRAICMLALRIAAQLIGRPYDMLNGLAVTALVMLMAHPGYIYDSGFLMSFTAVIGICAAQGLERKIRKFHNERIASAKAVKTETFVSDERKLRMEAVRRTGSALLLSTCVQLFMLPVLMNSYFTVNPYSVLINPIVIPFMSIVLVAGLCAGVLGGMGLLIPGRIFAGPVYYILKLYEMICEAETALPGANIITGAPETACVVIYYAVLLLVCITPWTCGRRDDAASMTQRQGKRDDTEIMTQQQGKPSKHRKNRKNHIGIPTALFLLPLCSLIFMHFDRPQLGIYIIDVGQGDANFIQTSSADILIDAGSTSVSAVGTYRVIPFLKYMGVRRLDTVYITHTDTDHISAIAEMLEAGYPEIGRIAVSGFVSQEAEVLLKAKEQGIEIVTVYAGDEIGIFTDADEMSMSADAEQALGLYVLAPEAGVTYEDANSASLVLELTCGEFSMLFTGDSDFASEAWYKYRLGRSGYSVLKCAHHGSKYSTGEELLDIVRPMVTTISCSKYNTYGHPNPLLLERLTAVGTQTYITADSGMITISVDSDGQMKVERWK